MIVAKIPRIAIKKKAGVNDSYLSIRKPMIVTDIELEP